MPAANTPLDFYTLAQLRDWERVTAAERPPLRLAVLGDPVAHSASPPMHNAALAACGIEARYCRLHIRAEELREALELIAERGFIGVNCTIPHKAGALAAVHEADENARGAGAVNTVAVEAGGRLRGFSTDGPGFERAVREDFGVELREVRVLVLGAGGGAGRAIAMQCAFEGCARLVLVNRTIEKARALGAELAPIFSAASDAGPGERLVVAPWEDPALQRQLTQTDLVIHCTAVGLKPGDSSPLSSALLQPHLLVYDTIYTATRTKLMLAADAAGARSANGLSMLLHQGALAFEIWFKRPVPLEAMRAALLAQR